MIRGILSRALRGLATIVDPRAVCLTEEQLAAERTDARRLGRIDAYQHVAEWCRPHGAPLWKVLDLCEKRVSAEQGTTKRG